MNIRKIKGCILVEDNENLCAYPLNSIQIKLSKNKDGLIIEDVYSDKVLHTVNFTNLTNNYMCKNIEEYFYYLIDNEFVGSFYIVKPRKPRRRKK